MLLKEFITTFVVYVFHHEKTIFPIDYLQFRTEIEFQNALGYFL